ncbi:MAG: hypothetical protein L6R41_006104 [Letrouitia leprolyta]|nr:MAG: hypothetical protein L6R41_006104 [Letrouitia leprolyta]
MLRSIIAAFAALLFALVEAQSVSLSSLPQCAQGPATSGLASTTCSLTDIPCICSAVTFIATLTEKVKQSCPMAEQQATLAFAQSLCSKFGVSINVPGVAAAENAASTPATSAAQAVSAPTSAAAADSGDSGDDSADSAKSVAAATSTDPTDVANAPVSSNDFSTSSNAAAAPTPAPETSDVADDDDNVSTSSSLSTTTSSSSSSLLVYDTKSVVPSATIAYSSLPTDASAANAQMATSTASNYANSTANTTVAASSPIPFVGSATSIKANVQGPGLAMIFVVGIFCWL